MAKGSGSGGRGGGGGGGGGGPAQQLASMTIKQFGDTVTAAAVQAVPDVGGNKTYINRAYMQLRQNGHEMPYNDFKSRLVQAQRTGEVRLSRADIPTNRRNVDQSEIRVGNSTFHFIRTD